MTRTRFTRRTAFRLASVFVTLFSVTMVAIFAILYLVITRDLTNNLKDEIDDLRETLVSVASTGGKSALRAMIQRRAISQTDGDVLLLTDLEGNYVAGNILPIPRFPSWKVLPQSSLPFIKVMEPAAATEYLGSWTALSDGYLLVANGTGDVVDVQDILVGGFGWAVVLTAIAAILGGVILGLSAQRRVDAIGGALDSFAHGNLFDRIRRGQSRDDLDHVAELINATLDRLQILIGSVKQVTTDIAHDLKTPINRIRQKLEVAQSATSSTEVFRATIDSVLVDIDQVVETFEALLRIAELGAGSRTDRFIEIELKSLLANVVEALTPVAEDRGQTLIANFSDVPEAHLLADRQLLNQLFVNLIENAIRHCPPNSKIEVFLDASGSDDLIVSVIDNGPGIPVSERKNVFRPLYRLEKSRTTPGSGLGLSLVAAIAELHKGSVTLEDADPGLRASVRLARRP